MGPVYCTVCLFIAYLLLFLIARVVNLEIYYKLSGNLFLKIFTLYILIITVIPYAFTYLFTCGF